MQKVRMCFFCCCFCVYAVYFSFLCDCLHLEVVGTFSVMYRGWSCLLFFLSRKWRSRVPPVWKHFSYWPWLFPTWKSSTTMFPWPIYSGHISGMVPSSITFKGTLSWDDSHLVLKWCITSKLQPYPCSSQKHATALMKPCHRVVVFVISQISHITLHH